VSLWDCLHDGALESVTSDTLARSIRVVVDVPYLWSFHSLPGTTRFSLVLQDVEIVQALKFASWPGKLVIPEGASWADSEEIRRRFFEKGRLESVDWQTLETKLIHTDEYEIAQASVTDPDGGKATLELQLANSDQTDYPTIRVTAGQIQFFLGLERGLSLPEFLALGGAYWQAFAQRREFSDAPR